MILACGVSLEFSLTSCCNGLVPVDPFAVGVGMLCMLFSLIILFSLFSSSTSVFKLSNKLN